MFKMYQDLKIKVIEAVQWAEQELCGKSGAEKKAAVIKRLDELIRLPIYIDWVSNIIIGYLVDFFVKKMNDMYPKWMVAPQVVDVKMVANSAPAVEEIIPVPGEDTEAKFKALCNKYNLTEQKSYFKKSEFACKCGCGTCSPNQKLIDMLNRIRGHLMRPIVVNSGHRCEAHNKKVGGAVKSNHLRGDAADVKCSGMSADVFYSAVMKMWREGKLPELAGVGRYKTFIHLDVDPKEKTLRQWDERKK